MNGFVLLTTAVVTIIVYIVVERCTPYDNSLRFTIRARHVGRVLEQDLNFFGTSTNFLVFNRELGNQMTSILRVSCRLLASIRMGGFFVAYGQSFRVQAGFKWFGTGVRDTSDH